MNRIVKVYRHVYEGGRFIDKLTHEFKTYSNPIISNGVIAFLDADCQTMTDIFPPGSFDYIHIVKLGGEND